MSELSEKSAWELLGGDEAVRKLVFRFYEIMDSDPSVKQIRDLHPADLSGSIDKLYKFLSGWLGGPQLYVQEHGHPRLRARHLPFPIGDLERDQWLFCMNKALEEQVSSEKLKAYLKQSFLQTADHMRNKMEGVDKNLLKAGIWRPER